jgi:hypothetical protein
MMRINFRINRGIGSPTDLSSYVSLKRNAFLFSAFLFLLITVNAQTPETVSQVIVSGKKASSDFILAEKGVVAPILVSAYEYPGVIDVLKYFQADVKAVTGSEPRISIDAIPHTQQIIIVGTLGQSTLIDNLVKANKLNVDGIKGKWENSLIEVVEKPFPNVDRALVIVGSDKRGTIFGVFDISAKIGVSPWYWWADVPVVKQSNIYIKAGKYNLGEPKVKYRGIFLNDEEPALGRWAVDNYGGFNHQFYTKLFELMLRLKSNYLWPAMWWASFNSDDPQNPEIADRLGIVIGTTHHEPMNRAHAEWKKDGKGAWNYETNKEELQKFWINGLKRIGDKEVIVNLGMRGDGDEAMTEDTNIALLEKIVADQRKMIVDIMGEPVEKTPQMWALYKEVQDYYDHGMRVPDDVTLLLCDDNWGNIRKLPKPGTAPRKGGYGIYYHFDYVGGPRNYKWLNTSPIARVWEQMNLAYEHGVDHLWLVNVGDLKPMEYPISFFLDYAWNPADIPADKLPQYAINWAAQQFGDKNAEEIASLLDAYTKFNSRRKPELLAPDTYSLIHFREAETVVDEYNKLVDRAQKVGKKLSKEYADAFYQLVMHPIEACANLNELYVTVAKNHQYAQQWRVNTNDLAKKAEQLFNKDAEITDYYHTKLSGGKWKNMMSQTHIGYTYWQQPEKNVMPEVKIVQTKNDASMGVAVEGSTNYKPAFQGDLILPVFDPFHKQTYYLEIFNQGKKQLNFEISAEKAWVKLSESKGKITTDKRIFVTIDWGKAPDGEESSPITITGSDGSTAIVHAKIFNPAKDVSDGLKGYVESNGYIAIEAENFTKNLPGSLATWKKIPGLGRTLSAMHPVPVNASRQNPRSGSPVLEYDFVTFKTGEIKVNAIISPTLNIYNDEGLEFAVSIDDQDPVLVNIHKNFSFQDWEESVRTNSRVLTTTHTLASPGNHTLKVWMVDPGIVLERIEIITGEPKKSYLGAPQSVKIGGKK